MKSKKTLTAAELKEYFQKNEEDIKSKYSMMSKQSKQSHFKARLMKRLDRDGEEQSEREANPLRQSAIDALKQAKENEDGQQDEEATMESSKAPEPRSNQDSERRLKEGEEEDLDELLS